MTTYVYTETRRYEVDAISLHDAAATVAIHGPEIETEPPVRDLGLFESSLIEKEKA